MSHGAQPIPLLNTNIDPLFTQDFFGGWSQYVAQIGLELARIAGMCHHTWPFNLFIYFWFRRSPGPLHARQAFYC
jgi:hypothetical protein